MLMPHCAKHIHGPTRKHQIILLHAWLPWLTPPPCPHPQGGGGKKTHQCHIAKDHAAVKRHYQSSCAPPLFWPSSKNVPSRHCCALCPFYKEPCWLLCRALCKGGATEVVHDRAAMMP